MDFLLIRLHNPNMTRSAASRKPIPSYRLYREGSDESAEFWLHCETIPKRTHLHNFEISAHRHDSFFQIFLVTAGSGEMLADGKILLFSAPCVLFIPQGAEHGFRHERDVDGIVVTALAERLRAVAEADRQIGVFAHQPRIVALPPGNEEARQAGESLLRIASELERPAAGRTILVEALMTAAIVCLARLAGSVEIGSEGPTHRDRLRVEQLTALVAAHMREHRPVSFYAERLGVSATHLNRISRAVTGLSVQALIARRMVETARRDLVFTPSPVQKIAYSLGFADPAYFNRFFRRQTGMTPGEFREAERRVVVTA